MGSIVGKLISTLNIPSGSRGLFKLKATPGRNKRKGRISGVIYNAFTYLIGQNLVK